MDSNARLIVKSVTWQALGFLVMSAVAFMFTGSLGASSGIALSGAAVGLVSYVLHEKAWSWIAWGRGD